MAAQKGKDLLLKIGDGGAPETFTTVAGLRARTLSLGAKTVDATDADSAGGWRELLAGAGVKSCAVTGAGVFRDAASDAAMREAFFGQTASNWQLVIPGFGVLQGPFLIATLEYAGQHDGGGDLFHLAGQRRRPGLHRLVTPRSGVNRARGEVAAVLGGEAVRLCLTLGALAEMETALGVAHWSALAERLAAPSAGDLVAVLQALLRGGGEAEAAARLPQMAVNVDEAAAAVARAFFAAGAASGEA